MSARVYPRKIAAIILGASEFPGGGERVAGKIAFANSAKAFRRYLTSEDGMGLREKDDLLCLFDRDDSPFQHQQEIQKFIASRNDASDVLIYYVGHGTIVDSEYVLATRCIHKDNFSVTGLGIKVLKRAIQPYVGRRRIYIILDCCSAERRSHRACFPVSESGRDFPTADQRLGHFAHRRPEL
jgi:hypothetical protein